MKIKQTVIALLAAAVCAQAGFEMPRHVYREKQLDEAIAEAKEKGKALAFVLTDETSS
ncbi:hypothetical protein [Sulfuriroseicoccus oceanibius]|uniref:Uncharacterized protein n=1 Tax=Sulfuriroseicoccus oceanibius TaxID=2707525 RepID=A0A6B3L4F8_9BACT|nr:hypothetical protein [Sulfuriroseicoccus oceanibius]QQL45047.1 hypothetical protein G3M56_000215 [Sulfuriroseicoccus oceanibius]